ncbi:hypothetical protein [Stutzerimonas stutzeri]|uniref:Uncharacterized protein n=1 Tax=Stutzerimonas stutzeri TaxID=316 RepID=A0AA40RTU1_STUST|nr:hypothetical protein [Stutzerimonas stutzeri]MBA1305899.1 hypothetical protein [Stutzerimonas stutzeri]
MARAKVTHSSDAVQITFKGDPRNPEPSTAVIRFPGGHLELSRCTDGSYWAHLEVVSPENVVDSRVDYTVEAHRTLGEIPRLPMANQVKKIALKVSNAVAHFDPDA